MSENPTTADLQRGIEYLQARLRTLDLKRAAYRDGLFGAMELPAGKRRKAAVETLAAEWAGLVAELVADLKAAAALGQERGRELPACLLVAETLNESTSNPDAALAELSGLAIALELPASDENWETHKPKVWERMLDVSEESIRNWARAGKPFIRKVKRGSYSINLADPFITMKGWRQDTTAH